MRPRGSHTAWRMVLAGLLAAAAGVSVGDDVVTAPDVHRGSRAVEVDLPNPFGPTTLHVPRMAASGVVVALHAGTPRAVEPLLDALAASTLVVPVDVSGPDIRTADCTALVEALALSSRHAQREGGLTAYRPPLLVGLPGTEGLTRALLAAGGEPGLFAGGLSAAADAATAGDWACAPTPRTEARARWRAVPSPTLVAETAAQLARPVLRPTTGHEPLDRWLTHFALPMSAAWASRPRAVLVLVSDAHALRAAYPSLAPRLAARDVSVLTIDALQYFWQRRSPRDVAFELRRLMGALTSLHVPVLLGGVGSGAETMAVAARYVEAPGPDALVLVDPGPSAFFEVDPPLPALVPLIRAEWSTRDAVRALAVPTLCATGPQARLPRVCQDLAGIDHVTAVSGHEDVSTAVADAVAALAERLGPRMHAPARSGQAAPRKPST